MNKQALQEEVIQLRKLLAAEIETTRVARAFCEKQKARIDALKIQVFDLQAQQSNKERRIEWLRRNNRSSAGASA
jgi:polyhydroxyalkanoate synthesis regulator phasin